MEAADRQLLRRLIYKSNYQHRASKYFQHIRQVSRWLDRIPDRMEDFENPENAAEILEEFQRVILKAYGSVRQHLIMRANFMPLALVSGSLLSSLYASVERYLITVVEARTKMSTVASPEPELSSTLINAGSSEFLLDRAKEQATLDQIPIIPRHHTFPADISTKPSDRKKHRPGPEGDLLVANLSLMVKHSTAKPLSNPPLSTVTAGKSERPTEEKPDYSLKSKRKKPLRDEIDDIFGF